MRTIVPIVEGEGEVQSIRTLLEKLIDWEREAIQIARPKNSHGRENLTKPNGIERFLELARREDPCDGVLILLDTDDSCPLELAQSLAQRASLLNLPFPVAVVCAKCEFEAWFLASLETIVGRPGIDLVEGTSYSGDVEARRGVKEWLSNHMPQGRMYKETIDQVRMTTLIDPNLARVNSRSFRRLEYALQELLQGGSRATPS